jgi:predicted phosphodiesterase
VVAVLYDIHGNLPALEAVLLDATQAGAERFVLGGDYALFGPWPGETVERLRELDATWIRGNGERWTARPDDAPDDGVVRSAIGACREELGPELVGELAALPEALVDGDTRYCHGSPISDVRSFLPNPGNDDDELLGDAVEDHIVFGHTHIQFRRRESSLGLALINPGSVGMPFDGDQRAAYAIVTPDGEFELRRVHYDSEQSAAAVRERFPEFGDTIARRISEAQFVT